MKLTERKLRKMIREEMSRKIVSESDEQKLDESYEYLARVLPKLSTIQFVNEEWHKILNPIISKIRSATTELDDMMEDIRRYYE